MVSVAPSKQDDFVDFMMETGVPFSILGHVTKGEILASMISHSQRGRQLSKRVQENHCFQGEPADVLS